MTHVLKAQARIAGTTKIAVPGVLAMAAFVALTSLAPAVLFGHHQDPHTVLEGAATIAAAAAPDRGDAIGHKLRLLGVVGSHRFRVSRVEELLEGPREALQFRLIEGLQ
jgi:hypothetical protein